MTKRLQRTFTILFVKFKSANFFYIFATKNINVSTAQRKNGLFFKIFGITKNIYNC